MTGKIEVYVDRTGAWRWRFRARNGQIAASSSEAYASKNNAKRAARRIGFALSLAGHVEVAPTFADGV